MNQRLQDVLQGKEANYMMPFFWQHGDHFEKIPSEIETIYQSGCRALCVESRPHPDFCGETWWRDMDCILAEAKKRDMQVWLLDDDRFPTGHAAGKIASEHPELRQWQLAEFHIDVAGPVADASFLNPLQEGDELLGIYAYHRHADDAEKTYGEPVCLTEKLDGNYLYWDIPTGVWRIFYYYASRRFGRAEYIDMMSAESCRVLLDAVYEPHYARYKEYFGTTFAGFFSDEPCLGNTYSQQQRVDYGFYFASIGKQGLSLPWNPAFFAEMEKQLDYDPLPRLNLLWYEDDCNGDAQSQLRYAYMDTVTDQYRKNFTKQLATWAHEHGVQYIGHIIEDMNCRTGPGAGHYFRALQDQDMSGIDVVLHQIIPGLEHYTHNTICSRGALEGGFYHYVLAKLGASLAHLNPAMQGRAMCEIFGAFGWAEDTVFMKYLADHMLVRGINRFVPHAFSSFFPDPDCPPHFGVEGKDPSFDGFSAIMRYMNRTAHLLEGADHVASAAILYNMEGEWASRFLEADDLQPAAKAIYDAHYDFDIVPADFLQNAVVRDGKLCIHHETFSALIIPHADHHGLPVLKTLKKLADAGLPVLFTDSYPENMFDAFGCLFGISVPVSQLPDTLRQLSAVDVTVTGNAPLLRIYHAKRDGKDLFMLFNEDVAAPAEVTLTLPCRGSFARVDMMALDTAIVAAAHTGNPAAATAQGITADRTVDGLVPIKLVPYQSLLLVFDEAEEFPTAPRYSKAIPVAPDFSLEIADYSDLTAFRPLGRYTKFFNFTGRNCHPDFSGLMRYSFTLNIPEHSGKLALNLGRVGQNARVTVNGQDCGIRVAPPYCYDISSAAQTGSNTVCVTVGNTLVHADRDAFSRYLPIAPSGLLGGLELWIE